MKSPEQSILLAVQSPKASLDVVLCSLGLICFAFFIVYPYPFKMIAFIPLIAVSFIIGRNMNWQILSLQYLLQHVFSKRTWVYSLIGLQIGVIGAMYYRDSFGMPLFPAVFRSFALIAISIGVMEELVFRGFIQGRSGKLHPGFAITIAAFAHASYKVFLFLSPASQQLPFVTQFYTLTFGVSILIGILRHFSKSMIPAIIAHAVFDLLVYAENLEAPWWVW